jgi:hypothetical protein
VPALELLSKETGVSLSVAPENLDTVGERKLAIIAQGLDLKSIMVQLCEALQEAHWDIDTSGSAPVYLLHRDSGMDDAAAREQRALAEANRPGREAALQGVRRALAMSPDELAELEKSDLFLARACRSPYQRAQMEALLALPPKATEELLGTGDTTLPFTEAPAVVQTAARAAVARSPNTADWINDAATTQAYRHTRETPEVWQLHYWFDGRKVTFDVGVPLGSRQESLIQDNAIPPLDVDDYEVDSRLQQLLEDTGTPAEEAKQLLEQRRQNVERQVQERWSLSNRLPQQEATNPRLRVRLALEGGDQDFLSFAQIQQQIARKTGLSIVSDYFMDSGRPLSPELRRDFPLWQLLALIAEDRAYLWRDAATCLTFHAARWPLAVARDIPEGLLAWVRTRLQERGALSLRDLAEVSARLTDEQRKNTNWPPDAGQVYVAEAGWALSLSATFTPEQEQQARSVAGLAFSHMTPAQQQQVRTRAAAFFPPLSEATVTGSSLHIEEPPADTMPAGSRHTCRFWLQFGDQRDFTSAMYLVPAALTEPAP